MSLVPTRNPRPSGANRALALERLVQKIKAAGGIEAAGAKLRRRTFSALTRGIDLETCSWAYQELLVRDSRLCEFRDELLETKFAIEVMQSFPNWLLGMKFNLRDAHLHAQRIFLGHLQSPIWEPEGARDHLASELKGAALSAATTLLAEGKISGLSIAAEHSNTAMILAGKDNLLDICSNITPERAEAIEVISKTLGLGNNSWSDIVTVELTCSPIFKGQSHQLTAKLVHQGLVGADTNLHEYTAAACYFKAFQRFIADTLCVVSMQALAEGVTSIPTLIEDGLENRQILSAVEPVCPSRIYVIGTLDRRITLYNEQVRALRVARALLEEQVVRPGSKVAVIGGGGAGVSAAIALASKGCEVHLFEAEDRLLSIQDKASHRHIHPHIFSWPDPSACWRHAGLPIEELNWKAGPANEVARSLREKAMAWADKSANLTFHLGARVIRIDTSIAEPTLTVELRHGECLDKRFDAVVSAVGFGVERDMAKGCFGYWEPDQLPSRSPIGRVLVSGTGDGGLIDVIRAALLDFHHDHLNGLLAVYPPYLEYGRAIQRVDEEAYAAARQKQRFDLLAAYLEIPMPNKVMDEVKTKAHTDSEVVLLHRSKEPLKFTSAPINKSYVLALHSLGLVRFERGELISVESGLGGSAAIRKGGTTVSERFDRVIVRHGPNRRHLADSLGTELFDASKPIAGVVAALGLTDKLDHATDEFFSEDQFCSEPS